MGRTKSLHLQIRKKRLTILRSYRRRETMYVCWVGDGRWIGWRGQREGSSCYGGEDPSEAGVETKEITRNQRPMVPIVPVFYHAVHCQHCLRLFSDVIPETSVSVPSSFKARHFVYKGQRLENSMNSDSLCCFPRPCRPY